MRFPLAVVILLACCKGPIPYHRIEAVDDRTSRGVPLVELTPLNAVPYVTDSNGLIAFHEAHLMGTEIAFQVRSHGYESPVLPGTDFQGVKITPIAGGRTTLRLKRTNIAERLYRLTGEGIYRDTVLLGERPPIRAPLLNAQIMGTDGAATVVFQNKLYWFFGDTNGLNDLNLSSAVATSALPSDPAKGIDLEFFVKPGGFTKPMIESSTGGLTWPFTPMVLPDASGAEALIVRYDSGAGLGKQPKERGLARFNAGTARLEPFLQWPVDAPAYPDGIAFPVEVAGERYFYFANGSPAPRTRVRATWKHVIDVSQYEKLPASEPPILDIATGRRLQLRSTSVQWNAFRKRWIMLAQQVDGATSKLGEIWYLEADTPEGPWAFGRQILTHDHYAFYEVVHHPALDREGGRQIYFSGTYSDLLSNPKTITPRYDYNVILYRLDLSDPRLALPSPVYQYRDGTLGFGGDFAAIEKVAFFAWAPDAANKGVCGQSMPGDLVGCPPPDNVLRLTRSARSASR